MKKLSRVTSRWLYSVFGVIVFILVGVEVILGAVIFTYYHKSVESMLRGSAENISEFYEKYISPDYPSLEGGIGMLSQRFSDGDTMEMQIIDTNGRCIYTSLGYAVGQGTVETEDFITACYSKETGTYSGKNTGTGERIMSVSAPLIAKDGSLKGVVRMVSSIESVNSNAWIIILTGLIIGIGIVLFIFVTNYYFIGTIITPLKTIADTAGKIAKGDMSARIENNYNDEVGELCTAINNMASEIAENEKMKNDFISSVSHELRTPMTAIRGWSETLMMCDPAEDKETVQRGLTVVNNEVERLSRMVEDLLDFSRIQSGRLKLNKTTLLLNMKLWDVVTIMRERAAKRRISLEPFIPDEDIPMEADGDRLNQVFINIIDNAVKHSPEGSVIRVSLEIKDNAVITVADEGEGISAEDLPHIKDKFYKGVNSKKGTGLGLAITDEIITLHGGELNIESAKGKGTTVTVTLPVSERI